MHSAEKKQVIKAIGDLGRRVTPADVAAKTGLPFLIVQQELNKVASETGGHLLVGTSGDIVYSFAPGFSNAYLARGLQAAMLAFGSKVFAVLFYLVRISFGIMLIVSLVFGILVIILISLAMMFGLRGGSNNDRDNDGGLNLDWVFNGGHGFHFTFWDWMILRDILWWNATTTATQPRYDYNRPTVRERPRSSFLLNCFSFLFGDGNPNEGLDEKRWQVIAQVIKRNNNVVTAEQLSPYTGADPKDEDAVLPVLVRFNGRPEVTSSGNIVYVFESMQSVAAKANFDPPAYLQEFPWKFSNVPDGELLPVYIVAGLTLAAVYTAFHLVSMPPWNALPYIHNVLMFMLGYAIAFIAIPLWRAVFNAIMNQRIDARNVKRFRFSQVVQHPAPELQSKLLEARSYKLTDRHISEKDVVFTTEKDARDQDDELTDKFKELEKRKPAAKDTSAEEDEGRVINVAPSEDGTVINIKKHAEEFDASP